MKILLLGDASNYHRALSAGLARMGHDVTLASDGSGWMCTGRDIDMSRPGYGKLGGALLWLRLRTLMRGAFRGYDVVQLSGPGFASLKPVRLKALFDALRKANGSVFMTALGTDSVYVSTMTGDNPPLRYSEWHVGRCRSAWSRTPEAGYDAWTSPELAAYTDYVYEKVDGVVSALYEYHRVVETAKPGIALAYGGIPVDLDSLPAPCQPNPDGPLKILLAAHRGREAEKGADMLFPLVRDFAADHSGEVSLLTPRNMPYTEFLRSLCGTDIMVDQLYSYTPATSALLGMALGAIPVSGAEPEFAEFIGEACPLPLINVQPTEPEALLPRLEQIIRDRRLLTDMRLKARKFVEKHNSADVVARRFDAFWRSRMK